MTPPNMHELYDLFEKATGPGLSDAEGNRLDELLETPALLEQWQLLERSGDILEAWPAQTLTPEIEAEIRKAMRGASSPARSGSRALDRLRPRVAAAMASLVPARFQGVHGMFVRRVPDPLVRLAILGGAGAVIVIAVAVVAHHLGGAGPRPGHTGGGVGR